MDITQLKAQYKAGERNFRGAKLSGVSLVWVELTGVNFEGADLSHTNLSGANLSESNFSGEANLTFADLSRADLRNTNLKGTRLEGANLEGIQLEGAVYDETTKFPLGFDPIRAGVIAAHQTTAHQKTDTRESQSAQAKTTEPPKLREKEPTQPQKPSPKTSNPTPIAKTTKGVLQKERSATTEAASDLQETKQPNWVSSPSTQTINPSEASIANTSGQGKLAVVPASIKGSWNWGALLLPWIWFLPNRVWGCAWIWLLGLIPGLGALIIFGFAITMAANGNTWAWQSRQWNSVEAFKKHQRGWAIAGVIVWGLIFWINLASRK